MADCTVQAEARLVAEMRERSEEAFADFVVRHGAMMRRVAAAITRDLSNAEEAVQETWLAVLKGLDRFEARSTLRTWVFRILVNRARSIAAREARLPAQAGGDDEPRHDPPADEGRSPEHHLLSNEMRRVVETAVAELPPQQRAVVTLRDLEGWPSEEVCEVLGITEGHQRVLLHRARGRVRVALLRY